MRAGLDASRSEAVVMLMLLGAGHGWPWSMGEIERELGDQHLAVVRLRSCMLRGPLW